MAERSLEREAGTLHWGCGHVICSDLWPRPTRQTPAGSRFTFTFSISAHLKLIVVLTHSPARPLAADKMAQSPPQPQWAVVQRLDDICCNCCSTSILCPVLPIATHHLR
jgi:hypothetical protein